MQDHKGSIVLIIEHEAPFGENVLNLLKDSGYTCYLVREERDGLRKIREIKPNLIIVDVADPQIDAFEILEGKKADKSISGIPTIVLSQVPGTYDSRRIASFGVVDQIVKVRIDPSDVLFSVDKTLAHQELQKNDAPHAILRDKKLLWVEDDKFIGNILEKRFNGYQAHVMLARNSDEAFAFLDKQVPHLIVLDLVLPGMSGFDILKKIRDNQALIGIPVIVFSNLNQSADVERAKILGAQRFFVKATVSLDQITKEVEELLR
jgi:DNA-binding response OmpR family regulator